jgi:hypothetical protein
VGKIEFQRTARFWLFDVILSTAEELALSDAEGSAVWFSCCHPEQSITAVILSEAKDLHFAF